jgi:hypothetical protein
MSGAERGFADAVHGGCGVCGLTLPRKGVRDGEALREHRGACVAH